MYELYFYHKFKVNIMKNLKRLFAYALLITGTFSLTAISCDDLTEDITVDIPTEVTKTIRFTTTETGDLTIVETVDMTSDELNEKREQMKDYSIETLEFDVVDNLEGGSVVLTNLELDFYAGETRVSTGSGFLSGNTFQEQLNSLDPNYIEQLKRVVEIYVLDDIHDGNPYLNITFSGNASGPTDYTITFTITGTIEATVE